MNKGIPDLRLWEVNPFSLILFDTLLDISSSSELHDDVEGQSIIIEKCLFIPNNVLAVLGC
jgi:hypothetical protein